MSGMKKFVRQIVLFDVDGTLSKSRNRITEPVLQMLSSLREVVDVGLIGGSDLKKITWQVGKKEDLDPLEVVKEFDYVFSENGLVAFKGSEQIGNQSILNYFGEEKLQELINFALEYMSKLILPAKRGNFIEFRTGMINICPVGRSCNQQERDQFSLFDQEHGIRKKFVQALRNEFDQKYGMTFCIGGQISIDVVPKGWDKTFCLQFLTDHYDKIYFFGDRTTEGGNDYEIYSDPRTVGFSVTSPEHTLQLIRETFQV